MRKVALYQPKKEDLWFKEECMTDPETMSYNAGYDLSFEGYHYDTGCIEFPKDTWDSWYAEKMFDPNFFYAYILDKETNKFVGYVNFKTHPETKKTTTGIVINSKYRGMGYMRPAMKEVLKEAKRRGVTSLTDTVPVSREKALKVFYDLGFEVVREFYGKKFNKDEKIVEIEKNLTNTLNK